MTNAVLVTGGAGFIGSHTCKELAASGYLPVSYDNLSTGHRDAVRWGPLVEGDIADTAGLAAAIRLHSPVALIHFAASAYVGESVSDPGKYYRNNVVGTLSVLEALRSAACRHLVFSSSCATYGTPDALPISETTLQQPINPYGRTKLVGEWMIGDFATAYGLDAVCLRYFNAAGADPEGEIGERHEPETHLLPRALLAAFGQAPHLDLMGTDYPTPDGTCIRDYIHVKDLARAHVAAVDYLLAGGGSVNLNIGTGTGHSILEVNAAIERVTRRAVPVSRRARRPGDPPRLVADPTLAREVLGFSALHSDIETIVATAAPFFAAAGLDEDAAA